MDIRIKTVMGRNSAKPGVLAIVDGYRVRWSVRTGWECDCIDFHFDTDCYHLATVADLLHADVTMPRREVTR